MVGDFFGGLFGGASAIASTQLAYHNQKKLMDKQYKINKKTVKNFASWNRLAHENAGYNPLLALGSNSQGFSANATSPPVDIGSGIAEGVSSALSVGAQKLQNKLTKKETEKTDADVELTKQQAETEKAKRIQMDFQNAESDVRTRLASGELSYQERRFNQELLESMERIKSMQANSSIGMMRAYTESQNVKNQYQLGKKANEINEKNSDINKKRSGFQNYKDYMDSKYGNPLKTGGYAWDKQTWRKQGIRDDMFW